jgi:hypothetical protein
MDISAHVFHPFPMSSAIINDNTSEQPFNDRSCFYGTILAAIGYGAVVVLSASSAQLLYMPTTKYPLKRPIKILLLYILFAFILTTISLVSCIFQAQVILLKDQNHNKQEPSAFFSLYRICDVSFLLSNWAANSIMVHS